MAKLTGRGTRMAHFAEENPNATVEDGVARGQEAEGELQEFEDSILGIIKQDVDRRRKEQYPEGSIQRMVSDFLDSLE